MLAKPIFAVIFSGALLMSQSHALANASGLREQYFESWSSYSVPMRPTKPIDYAETERLNSFYVGLFRGDQLLVRFTKYWKEVESSMETKRTPFTEDNRVLYFTAIPQGDGRVAVGHQVEYAETKTERQYFRIVPRSAEKPSMAEFIRVNILFEERYEYWPNGKLKHRSSMKEDGTVAETDYDEQGVLIRK